MHESHGLLRGITAVALGMIAARLERRGCRCDACCTRAHGRAPKAHPPSRTDGWVEVDKGVEGRGDILVFPRPTWYANDAFSAAGFIAKAMCCYVHTYSPKSFCRDERSRCRKTASTNTPSSVNHSPGE